jgi:hypothetical protein
VRRISSQPDHLVDHLVVGDRRDRCSKTILGVGACLLMAVDAGQGLPAELGIANGKRPGDALANAIGIGTPQMLQEDRQRVWVAKELLGQGTMATRMPDESPHT